MSEPDSIMIDDVKYIRADAAVEGLSFKIVRTQSAGVFAGYLESRNGQEVVLTQARRIWYWEGAASLSQLAQEGVTRPQNCKFAMPVRVELLQAIEILDVTKQAQICIQKVPVWKQ